MTEYEVIRAHFGDKAYEVGDTRKANPSDVAGIVGKCLQEKKAPKAKNKAEKPLKNKAAD